MIQKKKTVILPLDGLQGKKGIKIYYYGSIKLFSNKKRGHPIG